MLSCSKSVLLQCIPIHICIFVAIASYHMSEETIILGCKRRKSSFSWPDKNNVTEVLMPIFPEKKSKVIVVATTRYNQSLPVKDNGLSCFFKTPNIKA